MPEALSTESPNAVIADQGLVYCRMPNSEVIACDASDIELMKKIRRGWQVLSDYGQFGSSAYYMDHPYEPLFQSGGAREMSVEQVISLGYHVRPPLVPTCDRHVGDAKDHLTHSGAPGAGSAKAQGCWRGARPAHFPQLEGVAVPPAPFVRIPKRIPRPASCSIAGTESAVEVENSSMSMTSGLV